MLSPFEDMTDEAHMDRSMILSSTFEAMDRIPNLPASDLVILTKPAPRSSSFCFARAMLSLCKASPQLLESLVRHLAECF